MKWIILAIFGTAFMVNGQEAKSHSDAHKGNTHAESKDASDTAGQTVVVVNQQAPQGQENGHSSNSPSDLHELLLPQNLPNIGLVLVGLAGIGVAICSLRMIGKQVAEMSQQGQLMDGQLRAMHEQITEMSAQTAVAKESADAARDNIEMFVSKERARLWVEVVPIHFPDRQGRFADWMNYYVKFSGPTDAFIVASFAHTEINSDRETIPIVDHLGRIFPMSIPQVIGLDTELGIKLQYMFPEMLLKQSTIDAIKRGESFVHFFGFIKYRDVFDRDRETTFNLLWEVEPPFTIEGTTLPGREGWKKVGPPEANQST